MIVYNITIKMVAEIEKEWVQWQINEHIPDVMATGMFTDYKFYRLLEEDQDGGITYVVQYFSSSFENYTRYINNSASILRQNSFEKWGNKFIAFRTVMQVVN
jgi:hypothetical protein